jgi:hypothetical protein
MELLSHWILTIIIINNNKEGVLSVLGIIYLLILFFYIKFVFY